MICCVVLFHRLVFLVALGLDIGSGLGAGLDLCLPLPWLGHVLELHDLFEPTPCMLKLL